HTQCDLDAKRLKETQAERNWLVEEKPSKRKRRTSFTELNCSTSTARHASPSITLLKRSKAAIVALPLQQTSLREDFSFSFAQGIQLFLIFASIQRRTAIQPNNKHLSII